MLISRCKFNRMVKAAYEDGLGRGYGMGKIAGEAEARNKGYVLSQYDEHAKGILEVERMLKEARGNENNR